MTDTRTRASTNPYLAGNLAPVEQEVTAFDLPVTGQIPAEVRSGQQDRRHPRRGHADGP